MDFGEIRFEDVDWIEKAREWDQWRVFINTVTILWVGFIKAGNV
jgi:hypothetical protein